MSKPFIITGLDGLIINSEIFSRAHEAWFDHYCGLLKDESLKKLMHHPNYWDAVYTIMERALGFSRKNSTQAETMRLFAREKYRSLVIQFAEQYKQEGSLLLEEHRGTIEVFRSLKARTTLMLLTTIPEDTISFLLEKIGCQYLYEDILSSNPAEVPSAINIYTAHISPDSDPLCYIGSSKRTIEYFKELNVPTIFQGRHIGTEGHRELCKASGLAEYVVTTADEMKQILEENILRSSQ